ncbi:hypothetical protein [Defluviimonas salinarum]|uniref:hypothetical protein n=1 Tax=Defluviimonas salinarum TaxID=2992147 RepID=UPI0022311C3D|nr:hypothetical protein [Defluviimonas salinarum]
MDGTITLGAIEGPAWHNSASIDTKVAHFTAKYEAIGYPPGSEAMQSCILASMTTSETAPVNPCRQLSPRQGRVLRMLDPGRRTAP